MPEVPNLHPLFVQLQTRYPTSGLLTELVQMHADHFVVRAIVQLGNMTLATSLAAATTVEQAEDQARLRVLTLLGIHADIQPASIANRPGEPFPSASTPLAALDRTFKEMTLPPVRIDRGVRPDVPPSALPDGAAAIAAPLTFPGLEFEPVPSTDVPKASFPTPASESPVRTLDDLQLVQESAFDEVLPDQISPIRDDVPYDALPYDEEPDDEPEPRFEEEPDRAIDTHDSLPTVAEETASKSKPRKPGTSKEPTTTEANSPTSGSRDLSSLISQIGVEIDRIGWSKRQGSTYLQKTYGKKTRSELTDDELEDFLTYLNTQPSGGESL